MAAYTTGESDGSKVAAWTDAGTAANITPPSKPAITAGFLRHVIRTPPTKPHEGERLRPYTEKNIDPYVLGLNKFATVWGSFYLRVSVAASLCLYETITYLYLLRSNIHKIISNFNPSASGGVRNYLIFAVSDISSISFNLFSYCMYRLALTLALPPFWQTE